MKKAEAMLMTVMMIMKVTMTNNCAAHGWDNEDNNGDVTIDFYEECNNADIVDDYD